MAKAKKLPSGNWRCRASYVGSDGKKHFKSFTATTKREAEYMAAEYIVSQKHLNDKNNWTLGDAVDKYIELKEPVLSPATISAYRKIRKYAFQGIMDVQIGSITDTMLQRAINDETMRKPAGKKEGRLSAKTIKNQYGLISSTLKQFNAGKVYNVTLPKQARQIRSLPLPGEIYEAVKGSDVELPVLLAMWLSFTMSEIRGLTKSKSLDGDYITIREVVVDVDNKDVRKEVAKEYTRNRRHRLPSHIKELIDQVDDDIIVPMRPGIILWHFQKQLRLAGIEQITFHDLRHINASLMAMLRIPDKYAQERGGWKTDHIMKSVYTETFSEERQRVDDIIDEYFQGFI